MTTRAADARHAAELWEALRGFLYRNEQVVRAWELTPRRYQLLVMIEGAADGSRSSTVTELAARLRLASNTVTELVDRTERAGLLTRETSDSDGRVAHIRLTPEGSRRVEGVMAELRSDRATLEAVLAALGER